MVLVLRLLIGTVSLQLAVFGTELKVPEQFSTIQTALDSANNGDTVLVAPGIYRESLKMSDKSVVLASWFLKSGKVEDIYNTILDGTDSNGKTREQTVIFVPKTIGDDSRISGFTIQNGDDGIMCEGSLQIDHNRFIGHSDAIDYEDGGGRCYHNLFVENYDDAVDLDGACAVEIKHNIMKDNRDDGIEIRLHPYEGENLLTVISGNIIIGNGEDGIQFIDYDTETNRTFIVSRNIISDTKMAGIGFMNNSVTKEDYRAAEIYEHVWILNNTFVNNEYGITGSGSGGIQNNIFQDHRKKVFLGDFSASKVAKNLFWRNATSGDDVADSIVLDPQLDDTLVSKLSEVISNVPVEDLPVEIIRLNNLKTGIGATPDSKPLFDCSFWSK